MVSRFAVLNGVAICSINATLGHMKQNQATKSETETEARPGFVEVKSALGTTTVRFYPRKTPSGNQGWQIADYSEGPGKRRWISCQTRKEALDTATELAEDISKGRNAAAQISNRQAEDYFRAEGDLTGTDLSVSDAARLVRDALKYVGDPLALLEAARNHATRTRQLIRKPVADVLTLFLDSKRSERCSDKHVTDLKNRITRFANDFQTDTCNVSTALVSEWLGSQGFKPANKRNSRRALSNFFSFALEKGYTDANPVKGMKKGGKVTTGEIQIYTPSEFARLLESAQANFPDFLPLIALGGLAGVRSAELMRLTWENVDLQSGFITVGKSTSKTRSRRLIPICDSLKAWLADYKDKAGLIWQGANEDEFHDTQARVATATASADQKPVIWKQNGLRHSFISYRVAQCQDVPKVSLEAGNSPQMIFQHYRELVRPEQAAQWFSIQPQQPANVTSLKQQAAV